MDYYGLSRGHKAKRVLSSGRMTMEDYGRKARTTKYCQIRQWLCNTAIGLPDYVAGAFLSQKNAFPDERARKPEIWTASHSGVENKTVIRNNKCRWRRTHRQPFMGPAAWLVGINSNKALSPFLSRPCAVTDHSHSYLFKSRRVSDTYALFSGSHTPCLALVRLE